MLRVISELFLNRKDCVPFPLFLIYWLECGCASEAIWAMGRRARRVGRAMRWKDSGSLTDRSHQTGYNQIGYILKET